MRIAFIQVIATTGIGATVTDGGGLGRYIVGGFARGVAGQLTFQDTGGLSGAVGLGSRTVAVPISRGARPVRSHNARQAGPRTP